VHFHLGDVIFIGSVIKIHEWKTDGMTFSRCFTAFMCESVLYLLEKALTELKTEFPNIRSVLRNIKLDTANWISESNIRNKIQTYIGQ